MLKKLIVGAAALVLLAAAGAAGWWFAAERGLIPGRPNSPRIENFKRTLDEHYARSTSHHNRPCVQVDVSRPQDGMGPKDIRFDWTPASFRGVVDPRRPTGQASARRYAYLAEQGFFTAQSLPEGVTEYSLTWKGVAAATGQGCFQMAGNERTAEVLSFSLKRTENGVSIYEVIARPFLANVEPWVKAPGFKEAFPEPHYSRHLDPQPAAYELARGETGFEVIAEQGRSLANQPLAVPRSTTIAKLAGGVTPERAKEALVSYLAGDQGAMRARVCLNPPQPHEADENTLDAMRGRTPGMEPQPVTYTIYNILARGQGRSVDPLRGYAILKKFESLGFATSEVLPAAEFRGQAAAGAVRFTLTRAFLDKYLVDRCYPVGNVQAEEVLRLDPLKAMNPTPQFVARVKLKPWDAEAAKLLESFPHLSRLVDPGGVLRGGLQFQENALRVLHVNPQYPAYYPDVSEVRLPIVESPVAPPRATGPVGIAPPVAGGPMFEARSTPPMDITVREVERRARASVVQVDIRNVGSSVGSSFFLLCSIRNLAIQRGNFRHIVKLEERPRRGQMTIGFLRSPNEPPASVDPAFGAAGPAAEVIALDQFAPMCGKMK